MTHRTSPNAARGNSALDALPRFLEEVLILSAVVVGSILGAWSRIGLQFLKSYRGPEVVLSTIYANVAGSFILGVISEFQPTLTAASGYRLHRVVYVLIASAFCGSLTTFSTWQAEIFKLLLLQSDTSESNAGTTFLGARAAEYLLQLWAGFVVPLSALRVGQFVAQAGQQYLLSCFLPFSPPPVSGITAPNGPTSNAPSDAITYDTSLPDPVPPHKSLRCWRAACYTSAEIVLCFVAVMQLTFGIWLPAARGWPALAFTAGFGVVGAYLRYVTAIRYNTGVIDDFPLGTFGANIVATLVYGLSASLSKFVVGYNDIIGQSALLGVQYGFCGCLSTMSTLALEFHRLPLAKALRYVLASVVIAQLTLLVTLGAATFRPLQDAIAAPPPIDACAGFEQLCRSLLSSIGCPESDATAIGCEGSSLSGFKGRCTCASLDAGHRIAELLIDSQSAGLTVGALAPVWPVGGGIDTLGGAAVGGFGAWPTDVFDACLSFDNLCDSTLSRFACSPSDRAIASCSRRGLTFFDPLCACGGFAAASTRVLDLIVDTQLSLGKSLFDVRSYPTSRSLDFCAAYEIVCRRSLAHVQCPADSILIHGCNESGTTASLAPVCRCYSPGNEVVAGWDLSGHLVKVLMDIFYKPYLWADLRAFRRTVNSTTPVSVNMCTVFDRVCSNILQSIGCNQQDQSITACTGDASSAAQFTGGCVCGNSSNPISSLASTRSLEYIIDGLLAQDLAIRYAHVPPSRAPGSHLVGSSNFKQLLSPEHPIPGYTSSSG